MSLLTNCDLKNTALFFPNSVLTVCTYHLPPVSKISVHIYVFVKFALLQSGRHPRKINSLVSFNIQICGCWLRNNINLEAHLNFNHSWMQINIHMGNVQSDEKGVERMPSEKTGRGICSTMKLAILIQWHHESPWQEEGLDSDAKFSLSSASQKKKRGRGYLEFHSTRTCKARNVYRLLSEFVDETGTRFGLKNELSTVVEKHLPYRGTTGCKFGTWQRRCLCNTVNVLDVTELYTLKWLILRYVNFAWISKKMCGKEARKEKGGNPWPWKSWRIISGEKKANAWKAVGHLGAWNACVSTSVFSFARGHLEFWRHCHSVAVLG